MLFAKYGQAILVAMLAKLKPGDLRRMIGNDNDTPRKCLGYQTPNEVFKNMKSVALQS